MKGVIDAGGGMRAIYGAGVFDRFLDEGIGFGYCIGVSAGSANIASFLAGQRGRNYRFFMEYSGRKQYMGLSNFVRTGSYIDLDYIYATLTNTGGEDPIDFEAFRRSASVFVAVATDAATGRARYFTNGDMVSNDCGVLKTSCAIPFVCRPVERGERRYFDGGVADPVPVGKALADGCGSVVAILSRPTGEEKQAERGAAFYRLLLKKYPAVAGALRERHLKYNESVRQLKALEKQGKAHILSPDDCCGVGTLTRDRQALGRLYEKGYADAGRLIPLI